jgi:hypothetical protein
MPYIEQEDRNKFDELLMILSDVITSPGELNYVITMLSASFAEQEGGNYAALNATVGVLESAKLEFYRRRVAPYEDEKMRLNGDV